MCPRKDAHGCLRAVRRSVPVSASLQPLCEHYCAWPRSDQPGASTKEDQKKKKKKKRKEKRNHTLLSRCEKTEATLESKLDKQPARQGGKQAETCSVRPGVGRWLTGRARTSAATSTVVFSRVKTSVCVARSVIVPNNSCGGQARRRLTHRPRAGGARSGSERRARTRGGGQRLNWDLTPQEKHSPHEYIYQVLHKFCPTLRSKGLLRVTAQERDAVTVGAEVQEENQRPPSALKWMLAAEPSWKMWPSKGRPGAPSSVSAAEDPYALSEEVSLWPASSIPSDLRPERASANKPPGITSGPPPLDYILNKDTNLTEYVRGRL
ncbi:hypothetical protein EYF80_006380 [Liparis tanakae]|uniref:Uncharacterized protein n=1 Tax=Liparis tanakae TaxID=230148 RepID=A0A4Z2IZH0_9TELE|nr:hypothetical protein EYF80_006380 [Liparis tanakae]